MTIKTRLVTYRTVPRMVYDLVMEVSTSSEDGENGIGEQVVGTFDKEGIADSFMFDLYNRQQVAGEPVEVPDGVYTTVKIGPRK